MKKLMSGLLATTLAASFAFATIVPVDAAPVFVPRTQAAQSDVQPVQYRPWRKMGRNRVDRRFDRRIDRRVDRRADDRFYRSGGLNYYNGYRGYRDSRPGYRRYNDWWLPADAFVAGALVTGAINSASRSGDSHVSWCYDRYRSYRASDNTYQPLNGPRRQCYSPYD